MEEGISQGAVTEFMVAYRDQFKENITYGEAEAMLSRLVYLHELLERRQWDENNACAA